MTNPINLQIIDAIETKLGIIRAANGFNTDIGETVLRARTNKPETELPCCIIWPQGEKPGGTYGSGNIAWTVKIEGQVEYGSADIITLGAQMKADIIEAMAGYAFTRPFNSGGTSEIIVGDTIVGATSTTTGYVMGVSLSSGSWAGGDAVGSFTIRRKTGRFTDSENLDIQGGLANQATITGSQTTIKPIESTTNSLASMITYSGGGVDDYPLSGTILGVQATFTIEYKHRVGNPYEQE